MMLAPHDDPLVTIESLVEARGQLFRRWVPAFISLGLKLVVLFVIGGIGLYYAYLQLRAEWGETFTLAAVVVLMSAIVVLPFSIYVAQSLWLDFRIARRLDKMVQRVRAGESVRASEVAL